MKIIGPFITSKNLLLIAFEPEAIYVIKLGLKSLIKYTISLQLGVYSELINNIKSKPIDELKSKYKVNRLLKKEISDFVIIKNKFLAHKIKIKTSKLELNLNIEKRNKVDEYEDLISNWKNTNVLQHYI